jgi:hypothetical protein
MNYDLILFECLRSRRLFVESFMSFCFPQKCIPPIIEPTPQTEQENCHATVGREWSDDAMLVRDDSSLSGRVARHDGKWQQCGGGDHHG